MKVVLPEPVRVSVLVFLVSPGHTGHADADNSDGGCCHGGRESTQVSVWSKVQNIIRCMDEFEVNEVESRWLEKFWRVPMTHLEVIVLFDDLDLPRVIL